MEDKTPGFKIFGQEFYYPNTWQGTVAISISAISLCVCLAIIYIWADDQGRAHVEKIISQTRYNADGTVISLANIKQIQFWSPSPTTYKNTNDQNPNEYMKMWVVPTKQCGSIISIS